MKENLASVYTSSANRQDDVPQIISRRRKLSACVAVAIAGVSMLTAFDAEAAETKRKAKKSAKTEQTSVGELQAQVERLNRELAASKQRELDLIKRGSAVAPVAKAASGSSSATPSVAAESSLDVAQAETAEPEVKEEKVKNLGEVVVRSRHRIEKLHDVPLSISVVTGQDLEREQSMDLGSITKRASNITWNQGNQRTSSIAIRGVGKVGQTEAQDPSVGIIVDGVNFAYNPLSSSYDFTDVDTVEVTRGPQGTLQGKGATMGVVNITTKRPTFTNEAIGSFTYGNYDSYIAKGALGGAVIDNLLAWRGTFSAQKRRGDVTNLFNQDSTFQNIDRLTGRMQFLLTPTENFNARLAVDLTPNSGETTNGRTIFTRTPRYLNTGTLNTSDASIRLARSWFTRNADYSYLGNYLYGNNGQGAVYLDNQQPVVTGSEGAALEMNWDVLDHHFTSISAFKGYHFNAFSNDDGTPFNIMSNNGGYSNYYTQLSQEIRVASKTGGFIDYQGGIFLMQTQNKTAYNKSFGADAGAWFATTAQYNTLNTNTNGRLMMQDSLKDLWLDTNHQDIQNQSEAIFGQTNLHFTDDLTLTVGARITNEHRINPNSDYIVHQGNGAAFNPVSVNGVNTGGFSSNSSGALTGANSAAQLALANQIAQQYFGTANYSSLTSTQQGQVAAAKAIRQAQIGTLWNTQTPVYNAVLPSWTISPSYKINENYTTYVSWQRGMKAGIAQSLNGNFNVASAETDDSYELGLKSTLFNKTLVLNADIFWSDIKNYQQSVQTFDPYKLATAVNPPFTGSTGNVPLVRVAGLELDGVYTGLPYTSIRFAGAYNDAVYVHFTNAANPAEINTTAANPYRDLSGKTLPGAAKFTFNISPEIRIPTEQLGIDFLKKTELHTSFTETYTSRYNGDNNLSQYGYIHDTFNTDFAFGIGRKDKAFDISFVAKNLLGNTEPVARTLNSYQPAFQRWYGLQLSGKF